MPLQNVPTPEVRAGFYGQSVTLTGLLLNRGTPQQLIEFIQSGHRGGYDSALLTVYGDDSRH